MTGQQLCEAALIGDVAKVGTLLSTQGAQSFINYQDAHGCTPLYIAAKNGHESVTEQLIAARCNVNLHGQLGMVGTPLHIATHFGQATITKQLIAARCNVNLPKEDGATPLHLSLIHI